MGNRVTLLLLSLWVAGSAHAQSSPLPEPPPPDNHILNTAAMGSPSDGAQHTNLLLDQQTREMQGASSLGTQEQIQNGRERAKQMVELLKKQEMERALQTVTKRGKQALQEDPTLRTPMGVLAGAVGLWVGRSVRLVTGEAFNLTTRIEGRARMSEFNMQSPFLNGRFRFSASDGADINLNRKISSIDSQAEVNYNTRYRSFSGQVRKTIAPNLDFTFGAQQIPQSSATDGNARIEYRLDF